MAGRLVLTAGDPGGIGPDLCLALRGRPEAQCLAIAGDPALLRDRAKKLGVDVPLIEMADPRDWSEISPGALRVWPVSSAPSHVPGLLTPENAGYVLETLDAAVKACLDGGFDAMVTAPISKAVINEAGRPFSGHTEYIAEITGGHPVMLLTTPGLRVALATTHLPCLRCLRRFRQKVLSGCCVFFAWISSGDSGFLIRISLWRDSTPMRGSPVTLDTRRSPSSARFWSAYARRAFA